MTLPVPYFVYGVIKVDDVEQVGATVAVSTEETTTIAGGVYQVNIQDVATDGGLVTVTATYNGYSTEDSFTLDLSDPFKELDLNIITIIEGFSIYGNKLLTIYGSKPLTIYG